MDASASPMRYELVVRRGVPVWTWMWVATLLLTIPAIITTVRTISFESKRWRQG